MEQRLQAITKLFEENSCLDDFDRCEIVEMANCTTPELFEKLMEENEVLRENFEQEFREILLAAPENAEGQIDCDVSYKDIIDYEDLKAIAASASEVEGSFSYKHVKRLELKLFCLLHPGLLEANNLDKHQDINLEQEIALLEQSLKRQSRWTRSLEQEFLRLMKNDSLEERSNIIEGIKKQIMTISIDQLVNLITKTKKAQKKIFNQNGIVLIGSTGSGKTTTILSLLGHEMVEKMWEGQYWVTPKKLINYEGVKNLVACPSSKSITRNVTAIELPLFANQIRQQKIYLVDTPGFKDTEGATMDLSNTFGTADAIKSLNKAKFIVLLSGKDSGSRHQGLKQMAEILKQIFPNYNSVKKSVILFFNRYDAKDIQSLSSTIQGIWKKLPPSSLDNKNLASIYTDFIEKTSKKEYLIFNPINKNKNYAESINKQISKYPWVTELQNLFSVCYGQSANKDIDKQVNSLKDLCLYYFQIGQTQIAKYFIQQIQQLRQILGGKKAPEVVSNNFNIIKQKISTFVFEKYENIKKLFIKTIDTNSLCQKDIDDYLNMIEDIDKYNTLHQYVRFTNIKDGLRSDVYDKINSIVLNIKQSPEIIEDKGMHCLALLIKGFEKQDSQKELSLFFEQKLKQSKLQYKSKIQQGNFDQSTQAYNSCKHFSNLYSILLGKQTQVCSKQKINSIILEEIENQQNSISNFVQSVGNRSQQKFKEIKRVSQKIQKLELSSKYRRTIDNFKQVEKKIDDFAIFITMDASDILQQCQEYLSEKKNLNQHTISRISRFMSERNQMEQIPHLQQLIRTKSQSIDLKISSCLQNQKKVLEKFIEEMKKDKINFSEIKRQVNRLDQSASKFQRVILLYSNKQQVTLDEVASKIQEFFEDILTDIERMMKNKKNIFDEQHIQKLGGIAATIEAFSLEQTNSKKSKLLQREHLLELFKDIKNKSQNIFTDNISEIQKVIDKLQKEGKQKLDNQVFKYCNMKFKSVELCLNFIHSSRKIFHSIPQKAAKFQFSEDKLISQIKKWETQYKQTIEKLFEDLKGTEKDDCKQQVKELKKKIQTLQEVSKKYQFMQKILEPSTQEFIQERLGQQISSLYKVHYELLNKFEMISNPVSQITYLISKCQTLSNLNCFFDQADNFSKLEEHVRAKIQKYTKSLGDKFKFALDLKNYSQVIDILLIMKDNQKLLYSESQSQFCKVIQKQIAEIKDKKNKAFQSEYQLEFIVDGLIELGRVNKQCEQNQNFKSPAITSLLRKVTETIQLLSQNLEQYFNRVIEQIEDKIKQNRFEEAHSQFELLKKKKEAFLRIDSKIQINFERLNQIEENIKNKMSNFQKQYIENPNRNLQKFRQQYESIFNYNTTNSGQLRSLKNKFQNFVDSLIRDKQKEMEQKQTFTRQDLQSINSFISLLPQCFRNQKNCSDLQESALKKADNWQKQKNNINDQFQKMNMFEAGQLHPKVITFFKNKNPNENTKSIILSKIQKQLNVVIKNYNKKDFLQFVRQVVDCQELKSLQKIMIENKNEEIGKIYWAKKDEVQKLIVKIFIEMIYTIEGLTMQPKDIKQGGHLVAQIEVSVNKLLESLHLIEISKFFVAQTSKQSMKIRLNQMVSNLIKCYKKKTEQIGDLKVCLDVSQDYYRINAELKKVKFVYIMEYFLVDFTTKSKIEKYSSKIIGSIIELIDKNSNQFVVQKYKSLIQQQVMPRYEEYLRFSLQSNDMYSMSQIQMNREFKEKDILRKYLKAHFALLLDAVGRVEESQKINKIIAQESKITQQARFLEQKIQSFALQPSIDDQKIQYVKKNLKILQNFCLYYQTKSKIAQINFSQKIQAYHYEQLKKIQNVIAMIKQKQIAHSQSKNKIINQLASSNKQHLLQAEFEKKRSEQKIEYENRIKEKSEQEKEKLEKAHDSEQKSNNAVYIQQRKKISVNLEKQLAKKQNEFTKNIEEDFTKIAESYIMMITITENFISSKDIVQRNNKIINLINNGGKKRWLQYLVNSLNQIGSTTAKLIIYNNSALSRLSENRFNKNIQSLDIDQLLAKMEKQNSHMKQSLQSQLKKRFLTCRKIYETWLSDYKTKGQKIKDDLIAFLKGSHWNLTQQAKLEHKLKTVSSILALWTIMLSIQEDGQIVYLYQPHDVQILSLIILLGLVNTQKQKYKSIFAQIKTGEGKSLILAVLSAYFGLKKYEVDCVCYSSHLLTRDKNHFKPLFELLCIENRINYCTFNDLTETLLEKGDIRLRKQCSQLATGKNYKNSFLLNPFKDNNKVETKKQKKILLMDQADVFFMNEYYGNMYTPSFSLKSLNIKSLYNLIWDQRKDKIKAICKIQNSPQLEKVVTQFPHFSELIMNHLSHMIQAAQNCQHSYEIINDKIVYKDQDGYSQKVSYGYRTIFAYFYEYQRKTITKLPDQASSIELAICEISYAELPKIYSSIIGVTGTLRSLPNCKKQVMRQKYEINEFYNIPSVYKQSKRNDKGYHIVTNQNKHQEIVKSLVQQKNKGRPTIVFFHSLDSLNRFYHSQPFQPYQNTTVLLHQKHNQSQRNTRIKGATTEEKITLITSSFGRGTDFVVCENKIIKAGGVHVIITYFPEQKSEQVQLLGRVARQGDPGSSIIIISALQISEKLGVQAYYLTNYNQQQLQEEIQVLRQKSSVAKQLELSNQIKNCAQRHHNSMVLLNQIKSEQYKNVIQKVISFNYLPEIKSKKVIKTVLALDATGSMHNVLSITKSSLSESFKRVYQILKICGVQSGFSIQIVLYRNYNVKPNQLIETTPFERTADNLVKFIDNVEANGGWGNQALEIVYKHCLQIDKLDQIIIITDALPNTQQDIVSKYNQGCIFWPEGQRFQEIPDTQKLLAAVKQRKIKINALPIGNNILAYYKNLCQESGGQCELFNPLSNNHVNSMTDFIATSILGKLGDDERTSIKLMESYRKTYNS